MRMAAVFTLTTVNIARRTRIVSPWLIYAGLACAVVLLVGIGISPWVELVFPAWILALSLEILAVGGRAAADPAAESGQRLVELAERVGELEVGRVVDRAGDHRDGVGGEGGCAGSAAARRRAVIR